MSQISPEEMQRRGALLKKARQILIQEYAAIRTQQHQQWIRDSETSWKTNGVLMAYPPGKLYPTEQEIVDKALELYNKSIAANALNVAVPDDTPKEIESTTNTSDIPEPLGCSPVDVTAKLQEVYNKATTVPVDVKLIGVPVSEYIKTLSNPVPEQTTVTPEPIIEEAKEESIIQPTEIIETQPKHSLLRSVLSGWLSKNKEKDKDTNVQ